MRVEDLSTYEIIEKREIPDINSVTYLRKSIGHMKRLLHMCASYLKRNLMFIKEQ